MFNLHLSKYLHKIGCFLMLKLFLRTNNQYLSDSLSAIYPFGESIKMDYFSFIDILKNKKTSLNLIVLSTEKQALKCSGDFQSHIHKNKD